ncbi:sulfatase [Streptomyces pilosus]|uniref:sulfatase n=1 Tax=Streptomyces pilosus TaxID=28893 RepID=UPI001671AE67|nr:sulfatase [Streptomyces pilosus]GGV46100.1 sulfatase [Streptomyces pilosus]
MRAIMLMFDSLNRHLLPPYGDSFVHAPNFERLAGRSATFDTFYGGSMPCMPARRELHTGRHNFLHRGWGPLEPFDDSLPELLKNAGVHTHLVSDHHHYWEDGGATYHGRYNTWEFFRGQEDDPWKGVVGTGGHRQNAVNRRYMPTEAEHSQTLAVDAGLHFLETNLHADRWFLQVELFDPHEPFFSHQAYKDMYPHAYDGPEFDWPPYQKVVESQEQVEHARYEYAALVSMCDRSLGRVLDFMDEHDMWDDTLLVVNTDHGFLLGEHGWWAKTLQPWFNELVHLPFFLWDPRSGERGTRRADLSRTIDIAPTVLRYFGLEPTPDMQGRDLADDRVVAPGALFGIHGGHVNVTDGRHVYMRAARDATNSPLEQYTLMPTHMKSRFTVDEMKDWTTAPPFTFTKGLSTMGMAAQGAWINPWKYGTLLYDLAADPAQEHPVVDDEAELRMLRLLRDLMRESDAPASQYERLGIPQDGDLGPDHLLVREQRERATYMAEPLPTLADLEGRDLLARPLAELLGIAGARDSIARHAPGLVQTELVSAPSALTLIDLARYAAVPAVALCAIGRDLAALPTAPEEGSEGGRLRE